LTCIACAVIPTAVPKVQSKPKTQTPHGRGDVNFLDRVRCLKLSSSARGPAQRSLAWGYVAMSDKPGPQPDWFRRLRRSPWAVIIVAVGAVLTGLAAWTQAIDTLLLFTGVKPNALQLARDDERARFSRGSHTRRLASPSRYAALRFNRGSRISRTRSRPRLGALRRDFRGVESRPHGKHLVARAALPRLWESRAV
jgi:hypothetical protein